jgi:hypothetical protein
MMNKRDLKADLGWLSSPICGHILKRAIEAEALARELADMLGRVTPLELDLELVREAYGLLKKAKEVLGDE